MAKLCALSRHFLDLGLVQVIGHPLFATSGIQKFDETSGRNSYIISALCDSHVTPSQLKYEWVSMDIGGLTVWLQGVV